MDVELPGHRVYYVTKPIVDFEYVKSIEKCVAHSPELG